MIMLFETEVSITVSVNMNTKCWRNLIIDFRNCCAKTKARIVQGEEVKTVQRYTFSGKGFDK